MSGPLDIICLPHAGGSSAFYAYWRRLLPAGSRLTIIDLPGHGRRTGDSLLKDAAEASNFVRQELEKVITGPYVLFAHSMGSHLAYRALCEIAKEKLALCHRFLVSAARGPNVLMNEGVELHSQLPDEKFGAYVVSIGVLRADILQNKDFLRYFLPIIRADFKICESLPQFKSCPRLDVPLLAIGGAEDWVSEFDLIDWLGVSERPEGFQIMPGQHFYFMGQEQEIFQLLLSP